MLAKGKSRFIFAGDGDGDVDGDHQLVFSEEWFRQARLAAVKWILEVSIRLSSD